MRKYILNHNYIPNTIGSKIILHNYILDKGQPSYIGIFPVYLGMPLIFTDFPTVHMVETHFLFENLWISEPSLGILEKFQRSSALPNIKYNCAALFWSEILLGIYLWFKIYFLIDTNAKIWTEIIDLVVLGRNYWSSCRVQ